MAERNQREPTAPTGPPPSMPGVDEMNLAEFPIATLGKRDQRQKLECRWWTKDADGQTHEHFWVTAAAASIGLPTEFGERVLVALLALTAQQSFASPRVSFSVYQILKILDLSLGKENYEAVKKALKQLKGVTIFSKNAFWDQATKQRRVLEKGFNLIDEYQLRYRDDGATLAEESPEAAYIVWSETIWRSFEQHYIKELDLEFFYSLQSAISRRLYRLLDKRMQYIDPPQAWEMDIFELAARLGMAPYPKPAWVKRKLQPGFDELLERGYLAEASVVKHQKYTRVRFVKAVHAPAAEPAATPASDQTDHLATLLKGRGVSPKMARQLARRHQAQPERVQRDLRLLDYLLAKSPGRVKEPAGWLVKALQAEPPYTLPPDLDPDTPPAAPPPAEPEPLPARRETERRQRLAQLAPHYGTTAQDLELWPQVQAQLKGQMATATYETWLAQSVLLSLDEQTAVIGVATPFAQEWVQQRLAPTIQRTLSTFPGVAHPPALEVVVLEPAGVE